MFEAVFVGNGAPHEEQRQRKAGTHPPMNDRLSRTGRRCRLLWIAGVDLVGIPVKVAVEIDKFDRRHTGGLARAECARVDPREMRDVEEVVDHSSR